METPALPTIFLSIATLLASYLAFRCFTPPNPNPTFTSPKDAPHDTLSKHLLNANFLFIRRCTVLLIGIYQAVLILMYPSLISSSTPDEIKARPQAPSSKMIASICPNPQNPSPSFLTWTPYTSVLLGLIIVTAPIRLLAFTQLGPNFTFRLSPPTKLITTGLYAYVQHPSYSTNMLVILSTLFLLFTPSSSLGCLLPPGVVKWKGWGVAGVILVGTGLWMAGMRVRDEERMLKKRFGREWEEWHRRTARFIPGMF